MDWIDVEETVVVSQKTYESKAHPVYYGTRIEHKGVVSIRALAGIVPTTGGYEWKLVRDCHGLEQIESPAICEEKVFAEGTCDRLDDAQDDCDAAWDTGAVPQEEQFGTLVCPQCHGSGSGKGLDPCSMCAGAGNISKPKGQ